MASTFPLPSWSAACFFTVVVVKVCTEHFQRQFGSEKFKTFFGFGFVNCVASSSTALV